MIESSGVYIVYILRLWHIDNGGDPVWRFTLEAPGSSEKLRFLELADLVEFIHVFIAAHERIGEEKDPNKTGGENVP